MCVCERKCASVCVSVSVCLSVLVVLHFLGGAYVNLTPKLFYSCVVFCLPYPYVEAFKYVCVHVYVSFFLFVLWFWVVDV